MTKEHNDPNLCAVCLQPMDDRRSGSWAYCKTCTYTQPNVRFPNCVVPMLGCDGNAFAVMGRVRRQLRNHLKHELGWPHDKVAAELEAYANAATAGDYSHLLRTTMAWVEVG